MSAGNSVCLHILGRAGILAKHARRGEVLSLQRWQVDRERRIVTFSKRTKNGKTTIAMLTDKALEAIDCVRVLSGCAYVLQP
jgi:hypothetical protein